MPRLDLETFLSLPYLDDVLGPVPASSPKPGKRDPISQVFQDALAFFARNRRPPYEDMAGESVYSTEQDLAQKLHAVLAQPGKRDMLAGMHGGPELLNAIDEDHTPATIQDILDTDLLGMENAGRIFQLEHVKPFDHNAYDPIGRRTACPDFSAWQPMFDAITRNIAEKTQAWTPFVGQSQIRFDTAFVLHGLVAIVVDDDRTRRRGERRLHVVFSNGTESHMFLDSFAKALHDDPQARHLSDVGAGPLFTRNLPTQTPKEHTRPTGYVYLARTLSTNPALLPWRNRILKIGCTVQTPKYRVQNAKKDPTFFHAKAELVSSFALYGLYPRKVEHIIHQHFASRRLEVEVPGYLNHVYKPKEWFDVSVQEVSEFVHTIVDLVNAQKQPLS